MKKLYIFLWAFAFLPMFGMEQNTTELSTTTAWSNSVNTTGETIINMIDLAEIIKKQNAIIKMQNDLIDKQNSDQRIIIHELATIQNRQNSNTLTEKILGFCNIMGNTASIVGTLFGVCIYLKYL